MTVSSPSRDNSDRRPNDLLRKVDHPLGAWLLIGGAGYVAHVARAMKATGRRIVIMDDLSSGSRARVADMPFVHASVLEEPSAIAHVLVEHNVSGVIHLAGMKSVPESMSDPLLYYEQNMIGTMHVMEAAVRAGAHRVIYSSSAAVYGTSSGRPVTEADPTEPTSPYGESKLAAEWVVRRTAEGLDAIARHTDYHVERRVVRRRPGDVASMVADVAKIEKRFGWRARRDLDDIVASCIAACSKSSGTTGHATEPSLVGRSGGRGA